MKIRRAGGASLNSIEFDVACGVPHPLVCKGAVLDFLPFDLSFACAQVLWNRSETSKARVRP